MKTIVLSVLLSSAMWAQLPAPNQAGVAMGHLHVKAANLEPHKKLWAGVLDARVLKLGKFDVMKLPNLLVLLEKAESEGGTEGSVIGHVGVKVRDLKGTLAKAETAGLTVKPPFVSTPDGVRVELVEDKTLATPAANHHIHWYDANVDATRDWYVKMFGAAAGKRGRFEAADLPGVNLTFSAAEQPVAGTKGRVLDHIGFEVKNLAEFTKKLEAAGVKFDVPYRRVESLGLSLAFFTDPWGTYVELTEGLGRL